MIQMGSVPTSNSIDAGSIAMSMPKRGKKGHLGGPMNKEEIAMNQALLKEISHLKKNQPEKFS